MPPRLLHSYVIAKSLHPRGAGCHSSIRLFRSLATCILEVMKIDADWDPFKAASNERNHDGVRFTDAATVLADPLALSVFDHLHSDNEERWFTLGRTSDGTLLAVSHPVIDTRDESNQRAAHASAYHLRTARYTTRTRTVRGAWALNQASD